jgi:hypothetical protein
MDSVNDVDVHFTEHLQLAQQLTVPIRPNLGGRQTGASWTSLATGADWNQPDTQAIWIRMRQQAQESMPHHAR